MHAFRTSCLLLFTLSHKMRSCHFSFLLMLTYFSASAHAARFDITNKCPFPVWAAALPGGGRQLDSGESWPLDVNASTIGRIWARTGCIFDGNEIGICRTGDCGHILQCQDNGEPPNTLAEYALNQFNNLDFYDISLVDGFNVPMDFSPTSPQCGGGIKCLPDINNDCPTPLSAPGGCNNPCTVFKTDSYCCTSGSCQPTTYSRFFKQRCPDAYSYPKDDATSTFTCPGGTDYKVVFCPETQANRGLKVTFNITNKCSFVVWAAAVPGGGRKLNPGQSWALGVKSDTGGRIWARTGCEFNSEGQGRCDSGDCSGVLECRGHGRAPHTLAEYALKKYSYLDLVNISLVEGFNVPMEFSSASASSCGRGIKCTADINGLCPMELRDPGGCNNPCTVFNNDQFCCKSDKCTATSYSKFFKDLCPDVYTYPLDHDSRSTFSCLYGTDYNVVFCP